MLGRTDPRLFPTLQQLTGDRAPNRDAQSPDELLANVRQWKAALAQRFERQDQCPQEP